MSASVGVSHFNVEERVGLRWGSGAAVEKGNSDLGEHGGVGMGCHFIEIGDAEINRQIENRSLTRVEAQEQKSDGGEEGRSDLLGAN